MIDIHSHVIPFVDDGSGSLDNSLQLLKTAEENGVTDIVCTPHYRRFSFEPSKESIIENFGLLSSANDKKVKLHLGQEIAYDKEMFSRLEKGEVFTMNGTDHVLLEFSYTDFTDISGVCFECKIRGFKPIIAHIERYEYLTLQDVEELFYSGVMIQVNAGSLAFGSHYRPIAKKYLSKDLVHFIANDVHVGRPYLMKKAFEFVRKKYGEDRANKLFVENAKRTLNI